MGKLEYPTCKVLVPFAENHKIPPSLYLKELEVFGRNRMKTHSRGLKKPLQVRGRWVGVWKPAEQAGRAIHGLGSREGVRQGGTETLGAPGLGDSDCSSLRVEKPPVALYLPCPAYVLSHRACPRSLLTAPRSRLDTQRDKPLDPRLGSRGRGQFWRGNQTKSQLCNHLENFNEKLTPHLPVQPSCEGPRWGSGHDQRSAQSPRPPSPSRDADILSLTAEQWLGRGSGARSLETFCARGQSPRALGAFTAAAAWGWNCALPEEGGRSGTGGAS